MEKKYLVRRSDKEYGEVYLWPLSSITQDGEQGLRGYDFYELPDLNELQQVDIRIEVSPKPNASASETSTQ